MRFFANKRAVITGAGSGIGRALAQSLNSKGCHLILSDIDRAALETVCADLKESGPQQDLTLKSFVANVADYDQMKAFAFFVESEFRNIDLLINNAGMGLGAFFQDCKLNDMRELFDTNFWGIVYGCKVFLPLLERADGGHIVNISSILGLLSGPRVSAYCSSKFAVRGFSDSLRHDFRLCGNRVKDSCAFPSGIKTNILANSKIVVPIGTDSSAEFERQRVEHWFWTQADEAAQDILTGVSKGKTRIHVGKGAWFLDLISRLFPVSYTRFLPKSIFET